MESITDLKPDHIEKMYWKTNSRYATLVNAVLFDGKPIVTADMIRPYDSEETTVVSSFDRIVGIERRRDLLREITLEEGNILVGIENQQTKDLYMPIREMGYTYLSYENQLSNAKVLKPVFLIVLYYGDGIWSNGTSLKELMHVPKGLEDVFNDIRTLVVDVKTMDLQLIGDKEVGNTFDAMQRAYLWNGDNTIFDGMTLDFENLMFVATVTNSEGLKEILKKEYANREEIIMCEAYERVATRLKEEGKTEGRIEGKIEGRMEERDNNTRAILTKQMTKRFNGLSQKTIKLIENSPLTKIDEAIMNIFEINNEEEIIKMLN